MEKIIKSIFGKTIIIMFLLQHLTFSFSQENMKKSQNDALKVYKNDVKESIIILEKAGIKEMVNKKPNNISVNEYVSFLNDYAFYQMENKNYDKAIEILNRVLEFDYQKAVAHYNLGECHLYKAEENLEDKEIEISQAKTSFAKYVKLLKIGAKIPQKVKDILGNDLETLLKLKSFDINPKIKTEIKKDLKNLYESENFLISFIIPIKDRDGYIVLVEGFEPINGLFLWENGELNPVKNGITTVLHIIEENFLIIHSSFMDYGLITDEYFAMNMNSAEIKLLYRGLSDGESGGYGRGEEIGIIGNALWSVTPEQKGDILSLKIVEENKEFKKKEYRKTFKFSKTNIIEQR